MGVDGYNYSEEEDLVDEKVVEATATLVNAIRHEHIDPLNAIKLLEAFIWVNHPHDKLRDVSQHYRERLLNG